MLAHVLLAVAAALGVTVPVAVLLVPASARPAVSGAGTAVLGSVAVALGVQTVRVGVVPVRVSWLLPLSGAEIGGDALSGLFVLLVGAVAVATGIFLMGYALGGHLPTSALVVTPAFVATMLLVPLAGSVTTFLAVWELMALSSTVLVLTDHHRAACRRAGLTYAVMTHLGFLALVIGLVTFAAGAHSEAFAVMSRSATALPSGTRDAVFLLTALGFASKAGLMPLHAWLPQAHPEAPGPVSALMSAAMVTLGIYGLIRIDVVALGDGPGWWGLTILVIGAVSAVYAVLQASVATDLKRLLAYSTSENMGLVAVGLGAAMLFRSAGQPAVAAVAFAAALLQAVNHAAFKALAFLGASAVQRETGQRDLDELGGLAQRMPATSALFGVAALAGSGLPLGAAFISEWLLLQSLVHAVPSHSPTVALAMPVTVAAVALSAGLGVATMVKAFGVGFLARPRSSAADAAEDPPSAMVTGMTLAAAACVLLAVAPAVTSPLFARLGTVVPGLDDGVHWDTVMQLGRLRGSMSPLGILAAVTTAAVVVITVVALTRRSRPTPTSVPLWTCGAGALTSRMQYTAGAFAEPLQRVFDDVLRPDTDVEVSHFAESRYLLDRIRYRRQFADAVEVRLYTPIVRLVGAGADFIRRAHNGGLHRYLGYGMVGLLIALVAAR
ncbi:MAG TPA: proton-conducting transporter membrane subunit [Mycobacteriales bacterium]|nr:proton-conducting transporter membrane subunit [Mycobacteriales bacterium]